MVGTGTLKKNLQDFKDELLLNLPQYLSIFPSLCLGLAKFQFEPFSEKRQNVLKF